jgi:hypothetical protein
MANYLSLSTANSTSGLTKARFALKPLYKTPTTITVQFHWLRPTNVLPATTIYASGETLPAFSIW